MSLHLGVVRIGLDGIPAIDVLYDTTDSNPGCGPFAHVVYDANMEVFLDALLHENVDLGVRVSAG